jgi:hypothetical protein
MTKHAGRQPSTYAPEYKAPPAPRSECRNPNQVLSHPGAIQPSVKAVIGDPHLDLDLRRVIKHEPAMQLPPEVAPGRLTVPQIVVAAW